MTTNNVVEFVSRKEQLEVVYATLTYPLARMIHAGLIDPETATRDQFFEAIDTIGKSQDNAYEIHVTRVEEEMRLVLHCINVGEAKSGIVLLFTLLEGEVNTILRIHLRIRGFSPAAITDALRGTDFDTKLDILLPLIEVRVPERMRNAALQCKAIRNLVVHNKATPSLLAREGDKASDSEVASERATRFFSENPIERLQSDLHAFVDDGIRENEAVQWSHYLIDKFYEHSVA